ncbi:MAG: cupin domain-containing protein [Patescibacteria group bacterium]
MTEQEVINQMIAEGYLDAAAWDDGSRDDYEEHTHPFDTKLVMVSGEMELSVNGVKRVLRSGDTVEVLRGTPHAAKIDATGCRYIIGERH